MTLDRLDLVLVADGRHSVPTRLRVEGGGETRTVTVPAVPDAAEPDSTAPATVRFDPLTTDALKVVVEEVRPALSNDYYGDAPVVRPLGLAELGVPGITRPAPPDRFPRACRDDLLTVDGRPVGLRLVGSTGDALARGALRVEPCGGEDLVLDRGDHLLRATPGTASGLDLDRLVLRSVGDGALQPVGAVPAVEVVEDGRTTLRVEVRDASGPFWLVLGQSHNAGWTARVEGGGSLGAPTLVDGYANGWYVHPEGATDLSIIVEWKPQRAVRTALAVSAVAALLALGIAVVGWRRHRGDRTLVGAGPGIPPGVPEPTSPFTYPPGARALGWPATLALAATTGAGATLVASPLVGGLTLGATVAALRLRRHGRAVLTVGATGAFALAAAYVLARQVWRGGPPPDFEWPTFFQPAHVLAWVAVSLLAADVVVEIARRRPADEPPGPTQVRDGPDAPDA